MELSLEGKRVVVCAGSKGLGLAIAKEFYKEGAKVVICGRNQSHLDQAKIEITSDPGLGRSFYSKSVDLSKPEEVAPFVEYAVNQLGGGIDILVNNVGGPSPSSAEATSLEDWQRGFDQVFLSAVRMTQAVVPLMKAQNFGRIITITSLAVVEPIEHLVVSTAMRTGVTAFMKTLSREVAKYGITVNTVQPGVIHTDRIVSLRKARAERMGTSLEGELHKTATSIPAGRLGRPEELASLVVFLASSRASYITGSNIPVDGGAKASLL